MKLYNTFSRVGFAGLILLSMLVGLLAASSITAGVLCAPTVVFMSDAGRTGRLDIQNTANEPTEVSIRFSWGLPESDSIGNVYVNLVDSGVTDPRSALDWIKAFPRKIVLPPNGSQVVRIVARPPDSLPDGEYWARIVVTSRAGKTELPSPTGNEEISTTLNMVLQTALMLKYRSGECVAQLEMTSADADLFEDSVAVIVGMRSTGNTSYMGRMHARLFDSDHRLIGEAGTEMAVYRSLKRRLIIPTAPAEHKRPFSIEVSISSEGRTDVAAKYMIAGNQLSHTLALE
ncbi:MAG: hypothetical protein V3T31_05610 [candidate division Zixibacteria bacterium]